MRSARRLLGARLLVLTGVLTVLGCGGDGEFRGAGHNVLLISLDSTRRDLLGVYGRVPGHAPERSPSPSLDRLAREGVLLEEAYSTTSWTLPSHISMLTGQPELVHAVDADYLRPAPGLPTMAELLQQRGYGTAGFFSGPYLEPHFGFERGFDRYEACYGATLGAAAARLTDDQRGLDQARAAGDAGQIRAAEGRHQEAQRLVRELSHKDVSSREVTDSALQFLEDSARSAEPFFLFVHYFDPHYDYVPPDPHDERFDPDYDGEIDGVDFFYTTDISIFDPNLPSRRRRTVSERDLAHVQALYEGELEWTDAQIGRLLERLDELGLDQNTLVVVTADHGDEFFEHGGIGHRHTLYEEVVRVPLILRLPGVLPAGARVRGLVSIIDVLPTVLDLLDLPAPADLVSSSMVPLISGEQDPGERGVMGRLVTTTPGQVKLRSAEGLQPVDAVQVLIQETWRQGPIKVTRRTSWPRPGPGTPPSFHEALARSAARMRQREELTWIDLEAHPDEALDAHSSDFSDPRARAALQEFHDVYAGMLARRKATSVQRNDGGHGALLQGLGYGGVESPTSIEEDPLLLPPPGRSVLF